MLCKLSEISKITMGQSPKSEHYNTVNDGLPFLQGRTTFGYIYPTFDVYSNYYNKTAKAGDILFTIRAPVGDINIAQTTIAIGRGIAAITPTKCSTMYLYYLLLSNKSLFAQSSTGTIYESIDIHSLSSVELNIHDSIQQQHIVDTI